MDAASLTSRRSVLAGIAALTGSLMLGRGALGSPTAAASVAAGWIEVVSARAVALKASGVSGALPVGPLCRVTDERYAVYWGTESRA